MNYDIFMYLYSEVFPSGLYLFRNLTDSPASGVQSEYLDTRHLYWSRVLASFSACNSNLFLQPTSATYEAKLVSRTAFLFYFYGQRLEKTAPSLGPSLQKHVEYLCSVKVHTHSLSGIPWPLAVVVTDIIMSLINSHLQAMHSNDVYALRGGWDTFHMFVEGWTGCVYILLHSCNLAVYLRLYSSPAECTW